MKWCIITTIGKNPGDEFIRIGIENMIKDVDNDSTIELVDKETNSIFKEHKFDKCILAGMPVFWSFYNNNFWEIKWWKPIIDFYSKEKNKFMIMGAGSFQNWENIYRGVDIGNYIKSIKDIDLRSWKIILRDNIPNIISNSKFEALPCPAIFATKKYKKTKDLKLCNLMPYGGHYRDFGEEQSDIWNDKSKLISEILKKNDFVFVAHNNNELKYAKKMGWKSIITYSGKPELLLSHYKNCVKYFGNRIHGSIVARGVCADTLSCGFDSRQDAVKLVGGDCLLPSQIKLSDLEKWCVRNSKLKNFNFELEFKKQKDILNEFKNI